MVESSITYTQDGTWRVVLTAWKVGLGLYNSIGVTITAQHWEEQAVWLFFRKTSWFNKPVSALSISADFEGIIASTSPTVAHRGTATFDSAQADIRYFAFGAGIQLAPEVGPAGPGGAADLLIRAVRATGQATVNGAVLQCAEVYKG